MKTLTALTFMAGSIYWAAASEPLLTLDNPPKTASQSDGIETISLKLEPQPAGPWENGVGEGFRDGLWHAGFSLGGSVGVKIFGGTERHDLGLATIQVGRIISEVRGEGHWYRGNWDLLGELLGARQFGPGAEYVASLTPILRYDFATGTRWVPFAEAGAGVADTSIGGPDLANGFEFHLLTGGGLQWFYRDNLAFSFESRYGHVSDAGIRRPNQGLNTVEFLLGVTWYF